MTERVRPLYRHQRQSLLVSGLPTFAVVASVNFALVCMAFGGESSKVRLVSSIKGAKPVVARLDGGTLHLLYNSDTGPQYSKSGDLGKTWTAPVEVVDQASRTPGLEYQAADMAIGRNGRVHVAMSTNAWKLKLPEKEWALFYATLAPEATSFSPTRNLNQKPSEGFSLAADSKGNVTACWLSDKLYANVSHDDGATFSPTIEVNTEFDPCNCCTTNSMYGDDGRLAVLYREESNNERDIYLVLWNQQTGEISRTRVSSTRWKIDECPMSCYSIRRTTGGYVAAWPTKESIYFARLDNNGSQLSPGEIKTPGAPAMRTGMLALSAHDGTTLVAWKNEARLQWQLYDAKGQALSKPESAESQGSGVAGVVTRDGQFVLIR